MPDFGIYIHWPYCLSKCPYCDFFSKVKKNVDQEQIISEYLEDLDFYQNLTREKTVTSIFFGGGTPSLIKPQLIEKLINHIHSLWQIASDVEISLEANPNTDRPQLFTDLKSAGINRLSLGVQALNNQDLKLLGRTHSLQDALTSIDKVLATFDNHSMDLIYTRPEQTFDDWQKELKQAVSFGFKHLSMYQLTIEKGTVFHKQNLQIPDDETAALLYEMTGNYLQKHGYNQYEISNYAKDGFASSHNQIYWTGDDYLGIGQAAHGRFQHNGKIFATTHRRKLEELTPEERAEELLLMGLRLNRGIDKQQFQNNCGLAFNKAVNLEKLSRLQQEQLIINTEHNLKATPQGRLVLNYIIEELATI